MNPFLCKCVVAFILTNPVLPSVLASEGTLADAARHQDFSRVTQLLEASADPNISSADGTTALHWATHWNAIDL